MQAFSSCREQVLFSIAVYVLLIVVASLIVEHRLTVRGLRWLQPVGSAVAAQGL